jgi:hypothetical protein
MAHDVANPRAGFWRRWRHGIAIVALVYVSTLVLSLLYKLAVWAYERTAGGVGAESASVIFTILMVIFFLVLAPVLVSVYIGRAVDPDVRDELRALNEKCRSQAERFQQALDRSAEKAGLDWERSPFGRLRSLVHQGWEREALELYRREVGVTEAEAQEAVKDWPGKAAEVKLGFLLRHLEQAAGKAARA